jgi:hypothetical protein
MTLSVRLATYASLTVCIAGVLFAGAGGEPAAALTQSREKSSFGVTYGPWEPDPRSCRPSNQPTSDGSQAWEYTDECRQVEKCTRAAEIYRPRCWNDRPDCRAIRFYRGGPRRDMSGVCTRNQFRR